MNARIFKPCKSTAQSGNTKNNRWILQFEPSSEQKIDPIMGWSGGEDVYASQVILSFDTLEEAQAYAQNNNIEFSVSHPQQATQRIKFYTKLFQRKVK